MPRLCEFYDGICLTTEEKARKNLSQGKKNLSQGVVYSQDTVYKSGYGINSGYSIQVKVQYTSQGTV